MATITQCPHDDELVLNIKHANTGAFELLYKKYYNDLYRYGMKISRNEELTKDSIQEIFMNLWKGRANADAIRFIKLYLLKSLRRLLVKQMIKEQKMKDIPWFECLEANHSLHEEGKIVNDDWNGHVIKLLSKKIDALPARQQEALRLRFYQGMEYEKVACTMQVNYQSVLNHVQKSMKTLRASSEVQQVAYYRVA